MKYRICLDRTNGTYYVQKKRKFCEWLYDKGLFKTVEDAMKYIEQLKKPEPKDEVVWTE
jgi:hypothetical protein